MKRYLIFMFDTYYPLGGTNDFIGAADTKEEIKDIITNAYKQRRGCAGTEHVNILDTKTGGIIGHIADSDEDDNDEDELDDSDKEKLSKLLGSIED